MFIHLRTVEDLRFGDTIQNQYVNINQIKSVFPRNRDQSWVDFIDGTGVAVLETYQNVCTKIQKAAHEN